MTIKKTISNVNLSAGFTLTETVIAIGVLTVLLTGFLSVFTPATLGIRRSINTEQANRLVSTLENELITVRPGQMSPNPTTGFDKAFQWLRDSNRAANAILVYQYRANQASIRADGTPTPSAQMNGEPGQDYIIQTMARRIDDSQLSADLGAIEGAVFYVKTTQLQYNGDDLAPGQPGQITNQDQTPASNIQSYKEAVIAFEAQFFSVPTKSLSYLTGSSFQAQFARTNMKPMFVRNLAVRR